MRSLVAPVRHYGANARQYAQMPQGSRHDPRYAWLVFKANPIGSKSFSSYALWVRCEIFHRSDASPHGCESTRRVRCPQQSNAPFSAHETDGEKATQTQQARLDQGGSSGRRTARRCWRILSRNSRATSLTKSLTSALLVGAIAAIFVMIGNCHAVGINERIESEGASREKHAPTEPRDMFRGIRQYVTVSCPPPHIEKFASRLNVQNILRGESGLMWEMGILTPIVRDLWSQQSICRLDRRGDRIEVEIRRYGGVAEPSVSVNPQISCWCISTVLPDRSYSPIEVAADRVSLINTDYPFSENEGSFISDKRFSSQASLSTCRNPERPSESGDDNCCQGGNRAVVRINKFASAAYIAVQRDGDAEGFIFFGDALLVGWLVLFYAALKDWREGALNKIRRETTNVAADLSISSPSQISSNATPSSSNAASTARNQAAGNVPRFTYS